MNKKYCNAPQKMMNQIFYRIVYKSSCHTLRDMLTNQLMRRCPVFHMKQIERKFPT